MVASTGLTTASSSAAGEDSLAFSFATSYAGVIAFLAVVSEGSFAKAGDRLGIGRSAVSRNVQKLEAQLDARLFLRTTRNTALTREGELFYQNCNPGVERIMQALEEMRELRQGPPRGQLRICSTTGFGRKIVAPLLNGFHAAYPEIAIDFMLKDGPADFTSERIDVAFRDGKMDDSQIVAKQLIPMQMVVCASPEYAREHGLPDTVDALDAHRCINFRLASGRVAEWEFKVAGVHRKVTPSALHVFNDAELVLQAVLDGHGIAQLAVYQVNDLLRERRLHACLSQYAPDDRGHYACYLSRKHLPARIRVFVDYMTERIRALDLHCPTELVSLPVLS
ncbi:LysR family transcriptional regulator [Burkholderia dolosa]|uniref:LysR family transcriptional regulator n=1 Tax=Burkholderia dolosa TaxID=152500 RepID=UPI001C981E1A|nr:LysR family transcriptional regulator [Burkholderia dolosa]MBY4833754.1 LysR family transcriptional regulator [Burkholderia dolosa]